MLIGTASRLEEPDEPLDVLDIDLYAPLGPARVEPGFDEPDEEFLVRFFCFTK